MQSLVFGPSADVTRPNKTVYGVPLTGGPLGGSWEDLQRAGVLLSERGQEHVGQVDEQRPDGLLGRVIEPGGRGGGGDRK
jgi:hypothetical protein